MLEAEKEKVNPAVPPEGTVTCAVCGEAVRPAGSAPNAKFTVPLKPPSDCTCTLMLRVEPLITTCCGKFTELLFVTRKDGGPPAPKKPKLGLENEFVAELKYEMPDGRLATAVAEAVTTICPGEPGEAVKLEVADIPEGSDPQHTWKMETVPVNPFCGLTVTVYVVDPRGATIAGCELEFAGEIVSV